MSDSPLQSRGFTLIEVLVAVGIIAIGLTGVLATINGIANSSAYLRDKTLANWVAQNHIAELRLDREWPPIGKRSDDEEMANQNWRIVTEVSATPVEKLRRLDVSVSYKETPEDPLVVIAAFIGEPEATVRERGWREGARSSTGNQIATPETDDDDAQPEDGT